MHHLLRLSSLVLVLLGGCAILALVGRSSDWSRRRDLHLLVLAAPVLSLGLGILALHHFSGRTCFIGAPSWDHMLAIALPLAMGLVTLGALGLGLVRAFLMARLIETRSLPAGEALEGLVRRVASVLGATPPRVVVRAFDRPVAFTCGIARQNLVLSSWMLQNLDRQELEAVVAHELAHISRRDYALVWVATVLRDAFFYMPTSWTAYRRLQREKEIAADELAVRATGRPLELASALAKVWHGSTSLPSVGMAPSLLTPKGSIEDRIERLLTMPMPAVHPRCSRIFTLAVGGAAFGSLLAVQIANAAAVLAPMGCGPGMSM